MNKIKNTYTFGDIAIVVGIVAIGCIFLPFGTGWFEMGLIIVACGISVLPFLRRGYKISGEHGIYRLTEVPISRNDKQKAVDFLAKNTENADFTINNTGGALISVYHKKNSSKFFANYFDYGEILKGEESQLYEIDQSQYEKLLNLK